MTDERLAKIKEANDLGRMCLADPAAPTRFFRCYPGIVDELLAEVERLRSAEAAAFRRGFEAGREAGESACDAEEERPSCDWQDGPAAQVYCQQAARGVKRRIAALPVPEDRP